MTNRVLSRPVIAGVVCAASAGSAGLAWSISHNGLITAGTAIVVWVLVSALIVSLTVRRIYSRIGRPADARHQIFVPAGTPPMLRAFLSPPATVLVLGLPFLWFVFRSFGFLVVAVVLIMIQAAIRRLMAGRS